MQILQRRIRAPVSYDFNTKLVYCQSTAEAQLFKALLLVKDLKFFKNAYIFLRKKMEKFANYTFKIVMTGWLTMLLALNKRAL